MENMRNLSVAIFLGIVLFVQAAFGQAEDRIKGFESYEAGDYAKTIEIFRAVTDSTPDDMEAWVYLGFAYFKTGEQGKAAEALQRFKRSGDEGLDVSVERKLEITRLSKAKYTKAAAEVLWRGEVTLFVEFKADGTIGLVIPRVDRPYGMIESTSEAARKIRFKPPTRNGKPITMIQTIVYRFGF